MIRPVRTAIGTLLLLMATTVAQAEDVLIAVAANFTDATRALLPLFEQQTGHQARASFASTGKLYAQIEHGAPFEVFLAADSLRPQLAEEHGLAVAGSRFTYAQGRLVLWSTDPARFQQGDRFLAELTDGHLAIANPRTAPYGLAARQVLSRLQLWPVLQERLVRGDSIAQTFQFVATGNADAGFVAQSQVQGWGGPAGSVWVVPAEFHQPIIQQAVLLKSGAENPAARAWLDFLKSATARAIIRQYGYNTDHTSHGGSRP